jgi:hypothetical protein
MSRKLIVNLLIKFKLSFFKENCFYISKVCRLYKIIFAYRKLLLIVCQVREEMLKIVIYRKLNW